MSCSNLNTYGRESLVYLDKVFYDNTQNASPLMVPFITSTETFTQQLNVGGNPCGCETSTVGADCGCAGRPTSQYNYGNYSNYCDCCCNVEINGSTTFNVENAFVIVHSFEPADPTAITAGDITVDGLPITGIETSGGQLVGDLSGIMSEITKCKCKSTCSKECPGNFVMITADGPWNFLATVVVEGTLNSNATSCHFRACFAPIDGIPVPVAGPATFAFCGVDIPCQKGRISPSLIFDFDACASLLNPVVTTVTAGEVTTLQLTGSLVVTPQIGLKVTRPSLFNLSAYEVDVPCDDIGQCDACNPCEAECFDLEDNCCCNDNRGNAFEQRNTQNGNACQCCDTNGFGYF